MVEAILFVLLLAAAIGAYLYLRKDKRVVADDGIVRVQLTDEIGLHESMGTGSAPHLGHTPPPGHAVVEAITGDKKPLVFDTLKANKPAPQGTSAPWTNVLAPQGAENRAYKYGLFAVGDEPFELPSHLQRSDASYYRIWWSMEPAHE